MEEIYNIQQKKALITHPNFGWMKRRQLEILIEDNLEMKTRQKENTLSYRTYNDNMNNYNEKYIKEYDVDYLDVLKQKGYKLL